jgi:PhzF family phenazine biosynthesis protein
MINEKQALAFYLIDAFASETFKGNPTAVCMVDSSVSKTTMQQIAKEINLPVTVFVSLQKDLNAVHPLYYFTSLIEIPACGHATLAAAKMVSFKTHLKQLRFITIEGKMITAEITGSSIVMSYPKYHTVEYKAGEELAESLGLNDYVVIGFCKELDTLFIEVADPGVLRMVKPDYQKLISSANDIMEVVITSRSDNKRYDYLLRSFCPWIGINEDPVTGSVHSVLAGYWTNKLNKYQQLKVYQASERGGELFVTGFDDKVQLGGETVLVMEGEFYL